jgi:hypothetical protein
MSLQDDYFDLDAELKGEQKRKMRRIWKAFCEAEEEAEDAKECVRLVNIARNLLSDKPPLSLRKEKI